MKGLSAISHCSGAPWIFISHMFLSLDAETGILDNNSDFLFKSKKNNISGSVLKQGLLIDTTFCPP
jgi:hypothetical protein